MSQQDPQDRIRPETPSESDSSPAASSGEGLAPDEIFHLLQTNRRRDAMRYLHDSDGPVRMRDLAEQVAAWENDTTVRALTSTQRQRVYIPLYQTHLPKLAEAGVIEYNQSRGIVERQPLADELYPYIEGVGENGSEGEVETLPDGGVDVAQGPSAGSRRDWDGYYTGASGLGLGLVAGSILGLPVLSTLSGILVGTIVSVMFGLLTLARIVENGLAQPVE